MMEERAELGRFELKYAIPASKRDEVMDFARRYLKPDKNTRRLDDEIGFQDAFGYSVHSVYYDTPRLDDYYERLARASVRDRLRIRTYGEMGDTAPVFLENKRKVDDQVVKNRVYVCNLGTWRKTPGPYPWQAFLDQMKPQARYNARQFDKLIAGKREPVSIVHYLREVYLPVKEPNPQDVRFTIDHQVCGTIRPDVHDPLAAPHIELLPRDFIVLELKFKGHRPAWMNELCQFAHLHNEAVSKFGLSVALGLRRDHPDEVNALVPIGVQRAGGAGARILALSAESAR